MATFLVLLGMQNIINNPFMYIILLFNPLHNGHLFTISS